MQSFLKTAFVPSTDAARLASAVVGFVLAAIICGTGLDLIGAAPHDAAPTVGDVRGIVLGTILVAVASFVMANVIVRVIRLAFRK